MTRSVAARLAAVVTLSTLAAGCAPREPERHASAVDRAACRQRADQVYALRNRADVFRADTYASSTRDAPFAGEGLSGVVTRGLSGQYERDQMVSDCLSSAAGNVGTTPAAPEPGTVPQ